MNQAQQRHFTALAYELGAVMKHYSERRRELLLADIALTDKLTVVTEALLPLLGLPSDPSSEPAASAPAVHGEEPSGYSMAELGEPTDKLELVRYRGQELPRRSYIVLFEDGRWKGTFEKHVFEGSPESVAASLRLAAWGEKGNA